MEIVHYLLSVGADPFMRDMSGRTALEVVELGVLRNENKAAIASLLKVSRHAVCGSSSALPCPQV